MVSNSRVTGDGTHVEHEKDSVEVHPPGGDCLLIILCVENSSDHVPFTLFDDIPLDLRDGPEVSPKSSSIRYPKRAQPA